MLRRVAAGLCGALACATMTGAGAQAAEAPGRFDFRNLEYRYDGDAALTAARADLARLYPAGAPAAEAARGLAAAGASCSPADGQTRCVYSGFEAQDDHLVEVNWRVRIDADGSGAVRELAAERTTAGF